NKPSNNNFFITNSQIDSIKEELKDNTNIYYFTAVGNPTGEKIKYNDLYDVMKYIISIDQNAIFILDNVYVGLLKKESSKNMFKDIFDNKDVFERTIFCESLSKTLGTTGIRLAWIWTVNKELSLMLKKNIILKKAGYSKILDQLVCNLLGNREEIIKFQELEFEFISNQRLRFMDYIKSNYSHFFDFESSSSIEDREGIYVLLKIKPGYNYISIFAQTQIIGVGMSLSDGDYIRYSFGNTNYF
ncbi:aminotransferase class I/II-fold pyridoxal phosphate-dependent enzyme, partial [Candidatus Gracilibacteria bacterium]|nr:aminotransferase class I/II-fold pyridoxal phosphate-dependent enzyme [Candidatus Gracilibacteria bacterium]